MTPDEEYVKSLEKENETLRNRIEMNPTLADILKRYFNICKEVNRNGEVSYGLVLTPMAQSKFLREDDYNYLKNIGVDEEVIENVSNFESNVTVTNDNEEVNKLLDEWYEKIKMPDLK